MRKVLTDSLREKGIRSEKVLQAIRKIPRHFFLPVGFEHHAYRDAAYPIAAGQTISQPYTVAFQTELLNIKKYDKVLEIGTGSGYQAAVLMEIGAKVYTIERQKELFLPTQKLLRKMGYYPYCFLDDGYKGMPKFAPFDKIIITAGAESVPRALLKQVRIGGIFVAPIGPGKSQTMLRITRISEKEFSTERFGNFVFVPMLKGVNK